MVFSVKGSKNHAFEGNASLTAPDSVGERRCKGMVPSLAPPPAGVGTLQRSSEGGNYKTKRPKPVGRPSGAGQSLAACPRGCGARKLPL